ncbi:MAG: hypothetical protein NT084_14445 [Bacteroidetes bacterium]|nr:hypothetical protein [Bacteroidota bacterium]
MKKHLSEIQNDLQEYFNSVEVRSIAGTKNQIKFSSKIFELEVFLAQLKLERGITENYDASICSKNILKSFDSLKPEQYHSPADYQYPFSMWLLTNARPSESLFEHIDSFILSVVEFLNYPDIKITATGATRCKTNVRIAIMHLRNYGILRTKTDKGTRSHFLSSFGLLVFAYLKLVSKDWKDNNEYDVYSSLRNSGEKKNDFIDQRILNVIAMMRGENGFEKIWKKLELSAFSLKEKNNYEKLWCKFADMVIDNLYVTNKGIKENEKENKVIAKFIHNLKDEEEFPNIRKILLERIRNLD